MLIFIIGWFGICCVWLGGFAYIKSKNPTAKALGWASVAMYAIATLCTLFWVIYECVLIYAVSKSVDNFYDNYYDGYYNYYNYYGYYDY